MRQATEEVDRPHSGVDPVWRRYKTMERRRAVFVQLVAYALGLTAVVGALGAVSLLRWAHLYRQKHDEGNGFAAVAMLLTLSWLAALVASGLLVREAFIPFDRTRRGLLLAAACILLVVTVASVGSVWVEWHGDRCIGGC